MIPGYLVEERGSVIRRREMAHLPSREEGLCCHEVAEPLVTVLGGTLLAGGALLTGGVK